MYIVYSYLKEYGWVRPHECDGFCEHYNTQPCNFCSWLVPGTFHA